VSILWSQRLDKVRILYLQLLFFLLSYLLHFVCILIYLCDCIIIDRRLISVFSLYCFFFSFTAFVDPVNSISHNYDWSVLSFVGTVKLACEIQEISARNYLELLLLRVSFSNVEPCIGLRIWI